MFSSGGVTSHRLKYFFKIGAAWSSATHGARRGSLGADRARRSRCQKAISGELAMGRGFRIKMRMRRFARRHPWLTFTVRSFMIFSAAFGGAYGFIAGSRSEDAGYDPHTFAIGASFLFAVACVALATLSMRLRWMRRKLRKIALHNEALADRNWELQEAEQRSRSLFESQGDLIVLRGAGGQWQRFHARCS